MVAFGSKTSGRDLPTLEPVRGRGLPWWWLYESRCTVCGAHWLIAQEERFNDIFVLKRLSTAETEQIEQLGVWPTYFDRYETLLRLGAEAGHHARFMNPQEDTLQRITQTLLYDRPSISLAEVGDLLNLSPGEAGWLLEAARSNPGIH